MKIQNEPSVGRNDGGRNEITNKYTCLVCRPGNNPCFRRKTLLLVGNVAKAVEVTNLQKVTSISVKNTFPTSEVINIKM